MTEYVGYKDPIGEGLYNMGVTDERIVRCRDCKHSNKAGTICKFFAAWDMTDEFQEIPADVEPDGFCKWGEPRGES
jgi:hypothetical protein